MTFRLTKTDPYGRSTDVVRIIAQDDPACPVAAWRAWRAVLEAHDQHHTGPLLRRIDRHGRRVRCATITVRSCQRWSLAVFPGEALGVLRTVQGMAVRSAGKARRVREAYGVDPVRGRVGT